jgi:hypothetical protein
MHFKSFPIELSKSIVSTQFKGFNILRLNLIRSLFVVCFVR